MCIDGRLRRVRSWRRAALQASAFVVMIAGCRSLVDQADLSAQARAGGDIRHTSDFEMRFAKIQQLQGFVAEPFEIRAGLFAGRKDGCQEIRFRNRLDHILGEIDEDRPPAGDPDAPRLVATRPAYFAYDIALKDDVAYVASFAGELYVFDIANPLSPAPLHVFGLPAWRPGGSSGLETLQTYGPSGNAKATGVAVKGNVLAAVDYGDADPQPVSGILQPPQPLDRRSSRPFGLVPEMGLDRIQNPDAVDPPQSSSGYGAPRWSMPPGRCGITPRAPPAAACSCPRLAPQRSAPRVRSPLRPVDGR